MHEAKSQLSKLGELAWDGEKIIIAKAGKPYLELIPHQPMKKERQPGRFKGMIEMDESFNEISSEVESMFEADL